MKKKLVLAARLALLMLTLALLFYLVDLRVVVDCIAGIPPPVVVVLIIVSLFQTWMSAVRWQWVHPDESKQLSSWQYFRLLMVSKPFNLIMPGASGGDFVRTAITVKTVQNNRMNNIIAIVADRFIGLLSIILLGSLALIFISNVPNKATFYGLFGLLIGGFVMVLLMISNARALGFVEAIFSRLGAFGKQLINLLETWKKALLFFKRNYTSLLKAFMLCLPIHGLSFIGGYILARILGMEVTFFDISSVLALTWVITAIPLTLAGLGVRELSLIYLLASYGVTAESATALSVYLYIINVIMGLIGLAFLFITKPPPQLSEGNHEFSAQNTL